MRKNYSLVMMFAMIVVALNFNACGGDDEENSIGNNYTITDGKKLSQITFDKAGGTCSFHYDAQGRLVEWHESTITYKVSNITYKDGYILTDDGKLFLLNGRIVKYDNVEFIYDNDYLIEIRNNEEDVSKQLVLNFSWDNGNLVKIEFKTHTHFDLYTIDYSNYTCSSYLVNTILVPFLLYVPVEVLERSIIRSFMINAFGKRSRYLISRINLIRYYNGSKYEEYDYDFKWTMDKGLPVIMTETIKVTSYYWEPISFYERENYKYTFDWE